MPLTEQFAAVTVNAGFAETFPAVRTDQPLRLHRGVTAGTITDRLNRLLRRTIDFALDGPDQHGKHDHQQQNHRDYPAWATGRGVRAVSLSTEPSRSKIVRSK